MSQKKKRNKKQQPKPKQNKQVTAKCKYCGTACRLWEGDDFIKWRNVYSPNYKMDFLFVQECECWSEEGKEDWLEIS